MPTPELTKTHVIGRWKEGLNMEISAVTDRTGGVLAPGDTGWCFVSFYNTSDEPIEFDTALFCGAGSPAQTASAFYDSYYHGVGIASLTARWVNGSTVGQWQTLAPPDGPVKLAAGESKLLVRRIQAPETAGGYNLHIRLDTTAPFEAATTLGNARILPPDMIVRMEAVTKATITKR
jgi:hypothetical protein